MGERAGIDKKRGGEWRLANGSFVDSARLARGISLFTYRAVAKLTRCKLNSQLRMHISTPTRTLHGRAPLLHTKGEPLCVPEVILEDPVFL